MVGGYSTILLYITCHCRCYCHCQSVHCHCHCHCQSVHCHCHCHCQSVHCHCHCHCQSVNCIGLPVTLLLSVPHVQYTNYNHCSSRLLLGLQCTMSELHGLVSVYYLYDVKWCVHSTLQLYYIT